MESSAYEALMTAVYVIIFVTASSITLFLFTSTMTYAENAYEYGRLATGDSVIEGSSAPTYNVITGTELLSYYYNYKNSDKYGEAIASKYIFKNIDTIGAIQLDAKYALQYESVGKDGRPVITVKKLNADEILD